MVLTVATLIAMLAILGAGYQQIGIRMDEHRSPEAGRLVDVGGYRLKINCAGGGSPTVILESGLGDILDEWQRAQAQISSFYYSFEGAVPCVGQTRFTDQWQQPFV